MGRKGRSLRIYGLTLRGKGRHRNEDAILYPAATRTMADGAPCCLAAVADGVGGGPCGRRASRTAIVTLKARFHEAWPFSDYADVLEHWFAAANDAVLTLGAEEGCRGLATTLVAALVVGDVCYIANLGDSRAYLVRAGSASQLTRDHVARRGSLVRLTKAIGLSRNYAPDTFGPIRLQGGDAIALASDGLHGSLTLDDFASVTRIAPLHEHGCRLVQLALCRGSRDDTSVLLIRFDREHC